MYEFIVARSVFEADAAAKRAGWKPIARASWRKPCGTEVHYAPVPECFGVAPGIVVNVSTCFRQRRDVAAFRKAIAHAKARTVRLT